MTSTQYARLERRRMRAERQQQALRETVSIVVLLVFFILAFAFAGTLDYQDECRELGYWAQQGLAVPRW